MRAPFKKNLILEIIYINFNYEIFFSLKKVLKEILKSENDPQNINNFIDQDDCNELLEFRKSIKSKMVDREEEKKVAFNFKQSDISKKLKKKVEEKIGEFYVNDFEPHFVTTRFPLRLHVDMARIQMT